MHDRRLDRVMDLPQPSDQPRQQRQPLRVLVQSPVAEPVFVHIKQGWGFR